MEAILDEENLEIIDENSPVYIKKDAIPDVLAVRELDDAIASKEQDAKEKEDEVSAVQAERKDLSDKIGIINNAQHINQVALKLAELRELDEKTVIKESELEEIYADLRKLQEDRNALDESARNMVREMTDKYVAIVKEQIRLVEKYRSTADYEIYQKALELTDEANEFAAYPNYDAIREGQEIKQEDEAEETKEEAPEQKEETEEKAVETPEPEKAVVTELSEVKVDSLPENEVSENKEEKTEEAAPSEPVKAEVTPIESDDKVVMPTFEELLAKAKEAEEQGVEKAEVTPIAEDAKVEGTKPEVTAEAPKVETPVAEVTPLANTTEVKPQGDLEIKILTSTNDHIAGSNVAKIAGIKNVFANGKSKDLEKTLVLGA
ncbi:MAG: hypothetical protein IKP98_00415 [Bacilli bacterium]|nr:hypothetical protein [Bacilli bacterium]